MERFLKLLLFKVALGSLFWDLITVPIDASLRGPLTSLRVSHDTLPGDLLGTPLGDIIFLL